jgi:hypothetical protein
MESRVIAAIIMSAVLWSPAGHAAVYNATAITAIAVESDGTMYIRFDGLPNPSTTCGSDNNWVAIPPSANYAIKAEAIALYLSGKSVRIDTSGCVNPPNPNQSINYEVVSVIYSPGG